MSCLLACIVAIGLTAAISHPALNTGDYGRVTRSFGLEFAVGEAPAGCPLLRPGLSYPPASPLSVTGMLMTGAIRAGGGGCFPMRAWFALLSLVFWLGVLINAMPLSGRKLVALSSGSIAYYLLFAEIIYSFYEEAFFAVLVPWLAIVRFGGRWTTAAALGITFLALFSKAQAIFFIPVILLLFRERGGSAGWRRWGLVGAVIVAATALNAAKSRHYAYMNNYDRIYNGLGWSAMDVAAWAPKEFFGRRDLFYTTMANGLLSRSGQCAAADYPLLGTSYWPTGAAIMAGKVPAGPAVKARIATLGIGDFARCAWQIGHPSAVIGQIYAVFLTSDYNLAYLRSTPPPAMLAPLAAARNALLRWAGLVFLIVAIAFGWLFRTRFFVWSAAYLVTLSPAFVFFGDGYYEFEKHMFVNFMMLAACAFIAVRQSVDGANTAPLVPFRRFRDAR